MRVSLVTTYNERCGIAEYAKNLVSHSRGVTFNIATDRSIAGLINAAANCDILHINYEPGLFSFLSPEFLRTLPCRKVMTLHTSIDGNNRSALTDGFDRVVVHEKTTEGFTYIPHGISTHTPSTKGMHSCVIGTAGFPFPWKGFSEVVTASKLMGVKALVIAPESRHWNALEVKKHLLTIDESVSVVTDYFAEDEVIDALGQCAVNVFAYSGGNAGISGAVRMGIAARRPLVLTRCRQFRDLFDYEDEITFIDDTKPETIVKGLMAANDSYKYPKRILIDMNWTVCAGMYKQVYEELL